MLPFIDRVGGESGFNVGAVGDNRSSFGLGQLHYGGGLGDVYTRMSGHHASDPNYWQEQIDFMAAAAKSQSWAPWRAHHGDPWEGIDRGKGGAGGPQSSVTIGTINVASSKADPKAVADQIPDAMRRYSMLAGINSGLT